MSKQKVGFIGLGIMGKPMALNLVDAGYSLAVLKSNSAAPVLKKAGASVYDTPRDVASNSDIVITMLPDSPEVEEVILGEDGVIEGITKGALLIDMSTIAPSTAKKVYEAMQSKGVEALDAPVSGGQKGAEDGAVSIMVGGKESAFKRAEPIFDILGKSAVLIGDAGAGQMTKACNQIIVGVTIQAVGEAMTLAKKAGVDLAKVRKALLGGFAQSTILDQHGERIIERNFDPGFKIKLHRKDMNIALQAGREYSVPLAASAQVASNMDAILAMGNGELDHSALALFLEEISGVS